MIEIQSFSHVDLDSVVDIYNRSRASVDCFHHTTSRAETFIQQTKNEEILVAYEGARAIGFVSIWLPENFIHHLYVLPEDKRKGAANVLIDACVERFGLPLSLKSLTANSQACGYYEYNHWSLEDVGVGKEGQFNHYWLRKVSNSIAY